MPQGQKKTSRKNTSEPVAEVHEHGEQTDQDTEVEQAKSNEGAKSTVATKGPSRTSPKKGRATKKTAPSPAGGIRHPSPKKGSESVSKKGAAASTPVPGSSSGAFAHSDSSPSTGGEPGPGLSRKASFGNFAAGHHQQHSADSAHHSYMTGSRLSFHQDHSWSHLRHLVVHNPKRRGSKHRHHDEDHHAAPAPRDSLPSLDREKCLTAYHTHHDLLSSPWGVHQLLSECGLSVSPPLLEYFLKEVGLSPEPKDDDRFFLTAEKFLDIVALLRTNLPVIQSTYFDSDEQLLELACDGLGADAQHRTNLSALVETFNSFSLSTEPLKVFEVRKQTKVLQGKGGAIVEDLSQQQTAVPFETLSKLLNIEISEKNIFPAVAPSTGATSGSTASNNQRTASIFQAAVRKGSHATPKSGSLTPGGTGTSILVPPGRLASFLKSQQRQSFIGEVDRTLSFHRTKSTSKSEVDDPFGLVSPNVTSAGPSLSPFEFPVTPPTQGLTPASMHLPVHQGINNTSGSTSVLPPKAISLSVSGREKERQLGSSTASIRHNATANGGSMQAGTAAASGVNVKRRATLSPLGPEETHGQSVRSNHQQDSNNQSTRSFHAEFSGLGQLSLQTSLAASPIRGGPRGYTRGASPLASDGRKSSLESEDEGFGFEHVGTDGAAKHHRLPTHEFADAEGEGSGPLGEERRLTLSEQVSKILKRKREAREARNRPWTVDPHLSPMQRSDDMERLKPFKSHNNRIPEEIFLQMSSKIKLELLDSVDQGRLKQRLQTPPVHKGTDYPSPKRLPLIESSGCFRSPNPHGMDKLPTQIQRWVRNSV